MTARESPITARGLAAWWQSRERFMKLAFQPRRNNSVVADVGEEGGRGICRGMRALVDAYRERLKAVNCPRWIEH